MAHILRHKSWHVYNKDNKEKVRKDELDARIKDEKEELKQKQTERERRLLKLQGTSTNASFSLFSAEEAAQKTFTKSELEKQEWAALEKQCSTRMSAPSSLPWYAKPKTKAHEREPVKEEVKKTKMDIEALRKERLERERIEREKEEKIRKFKYSEKHYSSQYNPDYARY